MKTQTEIQFKKVVLFGSGPIVIGQACEFDYSGTQACKALKELGLEVVLINSNPATIMTDPDVADRVYVEPLTVKYVEKILEKEMPDAVIPTLGGQTALNLAMDLDKQNVFTRLGIKVLGATPQVILNAEDRALFNEILDEVEAKYAQSVQVKEFKHGVEIIKDFSFPVILRPNFTLGGGGGGVAYSLEEYKSKLAFALSESPTSEVLVEQSLLGWKEFELEVMRDHKGTFVVICSIENIDPCGVHTGDSITVAPQQSLSDQEYQEMRDEAKKILERVGVETGGANIQFAVNPANGERIVIEMNPRVSRSSALASKATGFPIAKIAAQLAVGLSLDEISNDITKSTPACFEPALDYVVTKIPKFTFEKFSGSEDALTTQMKSVGEVMSLGRTFKESFGKALLGLEEDPCGYKKVNLKEGSDSYPSSQRIYHIFESLRRGATVEDLYERTWITPWFLDQFKEIVDHEALLKKEGLNLSNYVEAKKMGSSDNHIADLLGVKLESIKAFRSENHVHPGYFKVDTCAGEFESHTPYFYSTYHTEVSEVDLENLQKTVLIIGGGPNRIGQGIEFDYGCVRGVQAFQKMGFNVAMLNSNPETVSTDYDTSDALFFEPLHEEYLLAALKELKPVGVVCQLGGQTPIGLARAVENSGVPIIGTSLEKMDLAEDRAQFIEVLKKLGATWPKSKMVSNIENSKVFAGQVGYPLMCRPSYVLGGRRMEIITNEQELEKYFTNYSADISEDKPCLLDQFLEGALEVDVDLIRSSNGSTLIGGIVEHIEAAGVHSGDSMGVIPPQRLKAPTLARIEGLAKDMAQALDIQGFLNLQLAIKDDEIFVIEANPRSSRTVPFISKATGIPLVDIGVQAMLGKELSKVPDWKELAEVCVKGVVFPFKKFPQSDSILGPEMKSTGESMGRAATYDEALLKAMISSGVLFPQKGEVFLSLRDKDKSELFSLAQNLFEMGFTLSATGGTADYFNSNGLECLKVKKVDEGRPHCVDRIRSGDVALVINTTSGRKAVNASFSIRRSCIDFSIPCITESDAAEAFILALKKYNSGQIGVAPLNPVFEI